MTKQEIIEHINSIEGDIDTTVFSENDGKNKIGCNQFRSLSDLCRRAECCEEIELLIAYKTSKGNGWNTYYGGKKSIGNAMLEAIEKIHDDVKISDELKEDQAEKMRLKTLELFFGYMYWKARIWSNANKSQNNSNNNNNQSRNNSRSDYSDYNGRKKS